MFQRLKNWMLWQITRPWRAPMLIASRALDTDMCACGHPRADHTWSMDGGGCQGCECQHTWSNMLPLPGIRLHVVRGDVHITRPGRWWMENEAVDLTALPLPGGIWSDSPSYQPAEMHTHGCLCGHKKVNHVRGVGACAEQACSCGRFLRQPDEESVMPAIDQSIPGLPPFERIFANARPKSIDVPRGHVLCTLCKGNKGCVWSEPGVANTTVYCVRCEGRGYHAPGYRDPTTAPKEDLPTGRKIVLDDEKTPTVE